MWANQAAKSAVRHLFGAHLSIAGGMHRALERAKALNCRSLQVFVKNQRQWRAAPLQQADVDRWHALLEGFGPVVAHAGYLINIASARRRLWKRSIAALCEELRRCAVLRIPWLVLHPGSARGSPRAQALARVTAALNEALERTRGESVTILLESTAGQGTALGSSLSELGQIIAGLAHPERVGVCLDTCHLFAAGYDLRSPAGYAAMLKEAEQAFGLRRVLCWHLNDSLGQLGSRRDRHAHIGQGLIGAAGFRNLLSDQQFWNLPMILETPKGKTLAGTDYDSLNLRRLRQIAASAAR